MFAHVPLAFCSYYYRLSLLSPVHTTPEEVEKTDAVSL